MDNEIVEYIKMGVFSVILVVWMIVLAELIFCI